MRRTRATDRCVRATEAALVDAGRTLAVRVRANSSSFAAAFAVSASALIVIDRFAVPNLSI
jgi:hypothetical protein